MVIVCLDVCVAVEAKMAYGTGMSCDIYKVQWQRED